MIEQKFHVQNIGFFGSFARDEQTLNSDVDILVEFSKPLGWEFFDLSDLLERELNRKVDLVSVKAIKPEMRKAIMKEVRFV